MGEEKTVDDAKFRRSIRLKYVKLGYHYLISNAMYLLTIPLLLAAAAKLSMTQVEELQQLFSYHLRYNVLAVLASTSLIAVLATIYLMSCPRKVYLVDFACYKPDPSLECTRHMVAEKVSYCRVLNAQLFLFY